MTGGQVFAEARATDRIPQKLAGDDVSYGRMRELAGFSGAHDGRQKVEVDGRRERFGGAASAGAWVAQKIAEAGGQVSLAHLREVGCERAYELVRSKAPTGASQRRRHKTLVAKGHLDIG